MIKCDGYHIRILISSKVVLKLYIGRLFPYEICKDIFANLPSGCVVTLHLSETRVTSQSVQLCHGQLL